jgi:haloalkane dehalogenase
MLRTEFRPAQALYPFESRWFDGPSGRMHYLDEGRGPPVLLVHGNPTWSFLYRKLIPKLTALGFRCLAPDLLGYGLSEHPARFRFTASEHAGALLAFVRALELDALIVFGQDWGGPLALHLATQMPASIRGIVLGSTFAWRSSGITRLIGHVLRLPAVQRYMVDGDRFIGHVLRLARTRLTPEELDHYRLVAATPELRAAQATLPRELIDADHWLATLETETIRSLAATRTLLFHPQRDAFAGSYVRRLGRLLPDHVIKELPNAGHFFQEDAPSEVAAAIRDRFG